MLIIGSGIWKLCIFCLKDQIIREKEESIMKKLFKGLSAFAIAAAVGFNSIAVNAKEACEAGEVEHTNYYMFLNVDTVDFLTKGVNDAPDGTTFTLWNGADKVNDVPKDQVISMGNIGVTMNGKSTNEGSASMPNWTVTQFWQTYYRTFYNADANLVFTDNSKNESYFYHDKWWKYTNADFSDGTERYHATDEGYKALREYLTKNISNISNSTLVKSGTNVPSTNITAPDVGKDESKNLRWKIARAITPSDLTAGVDIGGATRIWSPAVYYVKYCKAGGTTPTESTKPATKKKIIYDANTTDPVVSLPSPEEFSSECWRVAVMTPKRAGYDFKGWSKTPTGGVNYHPADEYCGDSITLYAVWEKIQVNPDGSFKVTYDGNDKNAKGVPSPQTANVGSAIEISKAKPTLTKNNFLGWSRDPKAKEPDPTYAPGAEYKGESGDITLYAVWQTQTGISAHFIAFGVVAIAAGAALVVAKKKDLFRQI